MNFPIKIDQLVMAIGFMFGLYGAWLNVLKDPAGFIAWIFSNFIFIAIAFSKNQRWAVTVFSVYFALAIIGLMSW